MRWALWWYSLAFCLAVFSARIGAQQTDECTALVGSALDRCQVNQQKLQQQQLTRQQQQLTQLQQELAQQQQQLAQQQEQLQKQQQQIAKQQDRNEILSKQIEYEKTANQPAAPGATDNSKRGELKSWKVENPWFGSDYARTQFAMRYVKQLQQKQPELAGRPFLDAVSAKVRDTFGANK